MKTRLIVIVFSLLTICGCEKTVHISSGNYLLREQRTEDEARNLLGRAVGSEIEYEVESVCCVVATAPREMKYDYLKNRDICKCIPDKPSKYKGILKIDEGIRREVWNIDFNARVNDMIKNSPKLNIDEFIKDSKQKGVNSNDLLDKYKPLLFQLKSIYKMNSRIDVEVGKEGYSLVDGRVSLDIDRIKRDNTISDGKYFYLTQPNAYITGIYPLTGVLRIDLESGTGLSVEYKKALIEIAGKLDILSTDHWIDLTITDSWQYAIVEKIRKEAFYTNNLFPTASP